MKENGAVLWRAQQPLAKRGVLFIGSNPHGNYRGSLFQNLIQLILIINQDVPNIQANKLAKLPEVTGSGIVILSGISLGRVFGHNQFGQ